MSDPAVQLPPPVPFASHRDIYVLVAGLLLGVLLSPAGLGNVAPDVYDRLFGAAVPLSQLRDEFDAESLRQVEQLEVTGVTEAAVRDHLAEREEVWRLHAAAHRVSLDRRAMGVLLALLAALAVVMALEALLAPQPDENGRSVVHPAHHRLISTRYALLAMLAALVLARPTLLESASLLVVVLAVGVALLVGLIPLGPRGGTD